MAEEKQCLYCGRIFEPNPRVGARQKACSRECAQARKKENNQAFARNNPGYWRGRYEETKAWRAGHPEYQRSWRRRQSGGKPGEIQAEIFAKIIEAFEKDVGALREIQAEFPFYRFENQGKSKHVSCRGA